jgi:hypothetical protein
MTVVADTPEDFTLEAFRRVTVDREGVIIGSAAVRPLASTSSGIPSRDGLATEDISFLNMECNLSSIFRPSISGRSRALYLYRRVAGGSG